MKRKTSLKALFAINGFMLAWLLLGVVAIYLVQGQVGWFLASLGLALGAAFGFVGEVLLMRRVGEIRVETARQEVESWPHVIRTLEELESIAPERAESFEVARLEMASHLEVSRSVAEGSGPSLREALRLWRKKEAS